MPDPHSDLSLDAATREILQQHGFEAEVFRRLREKLKQSGADPATNRIRETVEVPRDSDVVPLPPLGSDARRAWTELGLEAVRAGRVGAVFLAGGMATRFGGVVKAGVEVLDGRTFLDVKLADIRRTAQEAEARVPILLMTSFATHDEVTRLAAAGHTEQVPVETFRQFISVRLTPEGDLFRNDDGTPSLYAPGHGDLTFALRRSGALARFREAGGDILFMTNLDNVAATLDPAIVGAHLHAGAAVTVECAPKEPGDKGGAPARVGGQVQVVESFRFPEAFDQDQIPVFSTNTFVLDATRLDEDYDLTWFAVRKQVSGRPAIQFERLVGELTAFLPTAFLRVERTGPDGRFTPAKDPAELERRRAHIRTILESRGIL